MMKTWGWLCYDVDRLKISEQRTAIELANETSSLLNYHTLIERPS